MFKSLERADAGNIELDMQQVCERITKAAVFSAFLVWLVSIIVFPPTVAVPGDLLKLKRSPGMTLLRYMLKEK